MIDIQNGKTSAPVTPISASFHKLENIKSPVKEKKLSGYRITDMKIYQMYVVCFYAPYANVKLYFALHST